MKLSAFSRLGALTVAGVIACGPFTPAAQAMPSPLLDSRLQSLFAQPLGTLGQPVQPATTVPFVKCTKKGICELHGKVKVVSSGAKYKIKIVTSFPDIKVQKVTSFPDAAGKWQFVDSFPDFTVQIVTSFPDFTVQYVSSFPGC